MDSSGTGNLRPTLGVFNIKSDCLEHGAIHPEQFLSHCCISQCCKDFNSNSLKIYKGLQDDQKKLLYLEDIQMLKRILTAIVVAGVLVLIPSRQARRYLPRQFPGAVLYFDPAETDQGRNDKVWRNAGEAAGELQHTGKLPKLEEGND